MSGSNPKIIPLARRLETPSAGSSAAPNVVAELIADPFGSLWHVLASPGDGQALSTGIGGENLGLGTPFLATLSGIYGLSLSTAQQQPLRCFAAGEDVTSPETDGGWLGTNAALMLYNSAGATLQGMISADTSQPTVNESGSNWLRTFGGVYLHDGASFARLGSASAPQLATQSGDQALLAAAPGEWTLTHAPIANTQATATRAAGAAGVRHVLKSINATLIGVGAIAAPISVVVRDGASGAGPILWADQLFAPAAGSKDRVTLTGLNIIGSAATAMTLEFIAAPGATNFEAVAATGYSSAAQAV